MIKVLFTGEPLELKSLGEYFEYIGQSTEELKPVELNSSWLSELWNPALLNYQLDNYENENPMVDILFAQDAINGIVYIRQAIRQRQMLTEEKRVLLAHLLIVLMEITKENLDDWDLIFFSPVGDEDPDADFGKVFEELGIAESVIFLEADKDLALDIVRQTVEEKLK